MEYTTEQNGKVTVFQVRGQLDAVTSQELNQAVMQSIASGAAKLVFDLAALSYTSSAGLRVFISATQAARKQKGDVCIAAVRPEVAKVFALSGLDSMIKLFPDVPSAVQNFLY